MTTPDDPAVLHTAGARKAVERGDLGALLRHLIGWLMAVAERR